MTEKSDAGGTDPHLEELKHARGAVAVLKYELALLRSQSPNVPVLAFEGDDDKIVYYQWIKRITKNLVYEPFPCRGKKRVFKFREMLRRDLGGLGNGVYYFVDRDFDDMADHDQDEYTFMTDYYSVENYLVCENVLGDLLKNEFHCHARIDLRQPILELFRRVYGQLLEVSREINFRLFLVKRSNIELSTHVPQKITEVAIVFLDRVERHGSVAEEIIKYSREPTQEELNECKSLFDELEPATRYRGKFALRFFERWLGLLADDHASPQSLYFRRLEGAKVRRSELLLGNFASKSPLPQGLAEFVMKIE